MVGKWISALVAKSLNYISLCPYYNPCIGACRSLIMFLNSSYLIYCAKKNIGETVNIHTSLYSPPAHAGGSLCGKLLCSSICNAPNIALIYGRTSEANATEGVDTKLGEEMDEHIPNSVAEQPWLGSTSSPAIGTQH